MFQDPYPWDIRVDKFVSALAEAGHEVEIVSRNRGKLRRFEVIADRISVTRLPGLKIGSLEYILNFPAFFSPVWFAVLMTRILRFRPDVLIVRDLPLAPLGLLCAKLTSCQCIFDMAEDYPELIASTWRFRGPTLLDRIIRNPRWLKRLEKFVLRRTRNVFVVSGASKRRVESIAAPDTEVTVVGNTPVLNRPIDSTPRVGLDGLPDASDLKIVYTGYIEYHRGLDVVVRSIPRCRESNINVSFIVIGTGTAVDDLRSLAVNMGISDNVRFLGWIDSKALGEIVGECDIGIIPHRVTPHTNTTIPNKIFDYMKEGIPVIASNAKALEDIVVETGAGLVFEDGSVESLCQCIFQLASPDRRMEHAQRGKGAVSEKYNWDVDKKTLLDRIVKIGTAAATSR